MAAQQAPPYALLQIFDLYQLHKSLGITALGLVILRLLWRIAVPPPSLPRAMSGLERKGAHFAHTFLYVMMFALPISGWVLVSVESDVPLPTVLFKTIPWPHIPGLADLPKDTKATLDPIATSAHAILAWILAAFVLIHILAALRHGLILKDGVMSRMLPRLFRKSKTLGAVLLAGAALALPLSTAADASEWSILPDKSKIEFVATAGGGTYPGRVSDYSAEVIFDPDAPQITSVKLVMNTAGLTFGRRDYDEAVQAADWFDVRNHPQAMFAAEGAEENGNGEYTLKGQLTFKGVTQPVTVPMTIEVDRGEASVKGEASISRAAFGVGPASFAGIPVSDDVVIRFDLTAVRLTN
jgi:cytochrome b561